ncbi:MAG TPA: hypothetical protein VFA38_02400 [Nitrospirales bacterium]|nr:hypothetical protein [Nitrospirales bacterium]
MPKTSTDRLTYDELKAAEAAFRGMPLDPTWSASAVKVYYGIVAKTGGRNIVESQTEVAVIEEPTLAGSVAD